MDAHQTTGHYISYYRQPRTFRTYLYRRHHVNSYRFSGREELGRGSQWRQDYLPASDDSSSSDQSTVAHSGREENRERQEFLPSTDDVINLDRSTVTFDDFVRYCIPLQNLFHYGYPVEYELDPRQAIIHGTPRMNWQSLNEHEEAIVALNNAENVPRGTYHYVPSSGSNQGNNLDQIWLVPKNCIRVYPTFWGHYYADEGDLFGAGEFVRVMGRDCVRCGKVYQTFLTTGENVNQEICFYHWGKLRQDYRGPGKVYGCCGGPAGIMGCTRADSHVWDGLVRGEINGPFLGFVKTKPRPAGHHACTGSLIVGLDCEMCFTIDGFDVCKVTLVNFNGDLIYNCFVRPAKRVIDFNTRFSGVSEEDFQSPNMPVKRLSEVQEELLKIIFSETVIVGHGLENDLRVLKIMHQRIIDTALIFPHYFGLPYRRSLRSLAFNYLNRPIQSRQWGHDSKEDAKACLDLMVWKIRYDCTRTGN